MHAARDLKKGKSQIDFSLETSFPPPPSGPLGYPILDSITSQGKTPSPPQRKTTSKGRFLGKIDFLTLTKKIDFLTQNN